MNVIRFFYIILSSILLSSCGNYVDSKFSEETIKTEQLEVLSSSFDSIKTSILSSRCISCHQQYNNYDNVIQELTSIQAAIDSNRMPKTGGPLSDSQKAVFAAWVNKGAPEKNGDVIKLPAPNKLEANWKSINQNIITPKCLVCHNPQGQAKFLDLSNRQSIYDKRNKLYGGIKLINFDNPEESYLVQILNDEEEPMPPVWSNINRLTDEQVKIIKEWITLGLP